MRETLFQFLQLVAAVFLAQLVLRHAVRAELERVGLFRATRDLTEAEEREVMALLAEKKFQRAKALRDRYRHQVKPPED